jgi:hypothetical protein
MRRIAMRLIQALTGLTAIGVMALPPARAGEVAIPPQPRFSDQAMPDSVRHMAGWVIGAKDNDGKPFVIIDKEGAKVFVFGESGQLLGTAWALVGLAKGDESVPGIGTMPLTAITPDIRTTPAGRFTARLGHDLGKEDVLWVDYKTAISLHRVINTNPAERRLERIVSEAPADHRISYGCINVPAKFFDAVVDPTFKGTWGIVYILPEVKAMQAVFPAYSDGSAPAAPTKDSGSIEDHDLAGIVHGPGFQPAEK